MSRKATIFINDKLNDTIISLLPANQGKVSRAISSIADRYMVFVESNTPDLNAEEWGLLKEILTDHGAPCAARQSNDCLSIIIHQSMVKERDAAIFAKKDELYTKVVNFSVSEHLSMMHSIDLIFSALVSDVLKVYEPITNKE